MVPGPSDKPYLLKSKDKLLETRNRKMDTKYKSSSIPRITFRNSNRNKETLKDVLIRDIGDELSDFDIEFVSKYIATTGASLFYKGLNEEKESNFNKLIDGIIHEFPQLGIKLASIKLNYTMGYLSKTIDDSDVS